MDSLSSRFDTRSSTTIKYLLLVSAVVAVYSRSFLNEYAFDDLLHIVNNSAIQSWSTLLPAAFEPMYPGNLFRPVTVLSNGLIRILCGASALPHHVANVALHAANTALVALLFSRLHAKYPFLFSLLWSVLPIHLEVVANCTGRAELLSLWFGLSGTLLILTPLPAKKSVMLISIFLFTLSFGSKESGIVWCATPLLFSLYQFKRIVPRYVLCCLTPLIFITSLRYHAFQGFMGPSIPSILDNPLLTLSSVQRFFFATALLGRYACSILFPLSPGADYSWGYFYPNSSYYYLAPYLTVFCGLLGSLYVGWRNNHPSTVGLLWFGFAFLPTANILFPIGTIFGDRLGYTPSLGLVAAVSAIVLSPLGARITALFIIASSMSIPYYTPIWKSNESLYTHQKIVSLSSVKTKVNLSVIERNKGHTTRAEKLLNEALLLFPEYAEAHYNLAYLSFLKGNTAAGHQLLEKTLLINPNLPDAVNLAGRLALNENRLGDAFSFFKRLIDMNPYSVDGHIGLLAIAINSGDTPTAHRLLSRLDTIAPENTEVTSLRKALK